jgi:hypothetical protein
VTVLDGVETPTSSTQTPPAAPIATASVAPDAPVAPTATASVAPTATASVAPESICSNCSGCSKFSYLSNKTPKYNCSNKYHHQKIPATPAAALIAPTAPLLLKQASLLKLFPLPVLHQWVKLCANFSSFPNCSNCSNYLYLLQPLSLLPSAPATLTILPSAPTALTEQFVHDRFK